MSATFGSEARHVFPEALDLLRHLRRSGASTEGIQIAAADPLNLTGIILPGARTGALSPGAVQIVAEERSESGAA